MFCKNCGAQMENGAAFCKNCGARSESGQTAQPSAAPAPKKTGKLIAIIAAAVLIVAAVVVCIVLFTGGKDGPVEDFRGSVQQVIDSESFDFELSLSSNGSRANAEGSVEYGLKNRDLTIDMELSSYGESGSRVVVYKGYGFEQDADTGEYDVYELDESFTDGIFDTLEQAPADDMSLSEMLEILNAEMGGGLSEFISFSEIDACAEELEKLMRDEKWLKDNLDTYEKETVGDRTEYLLEINSPKIVEAVYDVMSPALNISDTDFEEVVAALENSDFEIILNMTVEKAYLTDFMLQMDLDGEQMDVELHLSNFGDSSLDTEQLDQLYEDVVGGVSRPAE